MLLPDFSVSAAFLGAILGTEGDEIDVDHTMRIGHPSERAEANGGSETGALDSPLVTELKRSGGGKRRAERRTVRQDR